MTGNWNPTPIRAEVSRMVVKRLLISRRFPIPREIDFSRNIWICHLMIKAPKMKPMKKRKIENGNSPITLLNSLCFRAGLKKDKTWAINKGETTIIPTVTPQLMERLIN